MKGKIQFLKDRIARLEAANAELVDVVKDFAADHPGRWPDLERFIKENLFGENFFSVDRMVTRKDLVLFQYYWWVGAHLHDDQPRLAMVQCVSVRGKTAIGIHNTMANECCEPYLVYLGELTGFFFGPVRTPNPTGGLKAMVTKYSKAGIISL